MINIVKNLLFLVSLQKVNYFMNAIKDAPAYWKKFLYEVLAVVKQLGLPTFLIFADLRWNELISVIVKLNGENLEEDDINNMDLLE